MDQRVWAFLAGLLTALLLAALLWLVDWRRASPTSRPPQLSVATVAVPTSTATPMVATVAEVPRGYRLAGVAENAGQLYAVVEQPDGRHGLFRQGEEVPGLGTVIRVGGEKAIFSTAAGELTLWVAPAPTATRTPTTPKVSKPTPTPRAPSVRSPGAGGSTPGSNASVAPDRSAS